MARTPSGGHGHRIARFGPDDYRLSWRYYTKHGRILFTRRVVRDTDRKGAERFAKKWNVKMPEEP